MGRSLQREGWKETEGDRRKETEKEERKGSEEEEEGGLGGSEERGKLKIDYCVFVWRDEAIEGWWKGK